MNDSRSWKDLYTAAMLELDRASLASRIEAAEASIRQAMGEVSGQGDAVEEKRAMAEAMRSLQTLRRLELTSTPVSSQSVGQDIGVTS